jgi:formamidopyrimidine-DNA glycosylase
MPEVVEVLITSQYLKYNYLNKTINKIIIHSGKYTKENMTGFDEIKNMVPFNIKDISSKGKILYFILESLKDGKIVYCISTFGLVGSWTEEQLKHSHIEFNLGKESIWYSDHRNFGNLYFYSSKTDFENKLNEREFDVLRESFDESIIKNQIKKLIDKNNKNKTKKIVEVLLEQDVGKAICSGIGNYLSAEILYHAKISPHKTLEEIFHDDNLIKNLTYSMKYITKLSYMSSVMGYMEQYKNFKKKHIELFKEGEIIEYHPDVDIGEDEFDFHVYQQKEDSYGNLIKAERIIKTRTTYWSPSVQH